MVNSNKTPLNEHKKVSITREDGIFNKLITYEIAFENFHDKTPVYIKNNNKIKYKKFAELPIEAQLDLVKEYNQMIIDSK